MNAKILLLLTCIAVAAAGCTSGTPPAATPQPAPSGTGTITDTQSCTTYADCVPAQCCHPAACTLKSAAPDCSAKACSMSCEGPLDCGAGSCGCVAGTCAVVPAPSVAEKVTVTLTASPQRYSPMMSSTPGIALTPEITGFSPAAATSVQNASDITWDPVNFEWDATFGEFLTWEAPDYAVHRLGNPAATGEKTVYWTYTDPPASVKEPVTITLTARDMTRQGAVLGTSTVMLDWDGNAAVYVGKIT